MQSLQPSCRPSAIAECNRCSFVLPAGFPLNENLPGNTMPLADGVPSGHKLTMTFVLGDQKVQLASNLSDADAATI